MREPKALISTEQLASALGQPDLRVYDCTTYLEPTPAGSEDPYIAVPGIRTFEEGHIPGADFLDLQGEFSDQGTRLRFMMPQTAQLEAAFGRHGIGQGVARGALQHRQHDVGDALLVDAAIARLRRCGRPGRRLRQVEGRRAADRERAGEGLSADDIQGHAASGPLRRQGRRRGGNRRHGHGWSSTRSDRSSTRGWSPAGTVGPGACRAASTFPRQRW